MKIEIKTAKLEIDEDDARDLFYSLKQSLESSIDSHWHNHPASYPEREFNRLHMMRTIGRMIFDAPSVAQYERELQERLDKLVEQKPKTK